MVSPWRNQVFQKWYLLKFNKFDSKIFVFFIVAIFFTFHKIALANIPNELLAVENVYKKEKTLEANFTQIKKIQAFKQEKKSNGMLFIEYPDKVRWEIQSPSPSLLMSDGKMFWHYTPPFSEGEKGQVIVSKADQIQSDFARALLSGIFSKMGQNVTIKKMKFKSTNVNSKVKTENFLYFLVSPKKGFAGTVKEALIQIDKDKSQIQKITMSHYGGNTLIIELSDIKFGKKIDPSIFTFDTSKNVEIISQ